jgi:hypothetical protein
MQQSISAVFAAVVAIGTVAVTFTQAEAAAIPAMPAGAVHSTAGDNILEAQAGSEDRLLQRPHQRWKHYDRDRRYRGHYRQHRRHYQRYVVPQPFFYEFPFFVPPRHHHNHRHYW